MLTRKLIRKSIYRCSEVIMGLVMILFERELDQAWLLQSSLSRERHINFLHICLSLSLDKYFYTHYKIVAAQKGQ